MLLASSGGVDSVVQFITVLIIFAIVLGMTLFVTRWIAGFQKNQMAGSNISVIETTKISPSQYIQIVKIGTKYVAIAVSKDSITLLSELNETDIDFGKQGSVSTDFSTVLNKFKTNLQKKEGTDENTSNEDEE